MRITDNMRMRKFMVVIDDTPECANAIRFAMLRAARTGGGVVMLYVIVPSGEGSLWLSVGDRMRNEAYEQADARLQALADEYADICDIMPEFMIREGEPEKEIVAAIAEDPGIRVLVLAASNVGEGPGPLVSALAGRRAGFMPVPVTVVPGNLTPDQIDQVT